MNAFSGQGKTGERHHSEDGVRSPAVGDLRQLLREKFPEAQVRYDAVSEGVEKSARVKEATGGVIPLPQSGIYGTSGGSAAHERDGGKFLQTVLIN